MSGALAPLVISCTVRESEGSKRIQGSWISGFALFGYAAAFSQAYVSLNTAMGAIILFGTVQMSMFAAALWAGERLSLVQWLGSTAAFAGLVYLVWPGMSAPDLLGAVLMAVSGLSWGVYSIRGKGVTTRLKWAFFTGGT